MTDQHTLSQPDPRAVRRGRIIASLLFIIALLPVVLATWMYFGGWGATGATANKGELLQPVAPVADFGFVDADGQPLVNRFYPVVEEPRWLVLTLARECDTACEDALYETRQVHTALGRERDRVERALWVDEPAPETLAQLDKTYPDVIRLELPAGAAQPALPGAGSLEQSYQIYIVDPNGNVVLRYDAMNTGEDLLEDLEKLLRLSNIG